MSITQDDFNPATDLENELGIEFGNVFYLEYYGINVFLCVCRVGPHQVAVYEVKKRKIKKREYIDSKLDSARNPLIIKERNGWTISDFWVDTILKDGQKTIAIPISSSSPIYEKTIKKGIEFPDTGEFYAVLLDSINYYWES